MDIQNVIKRHGFTQEQVAAQMTSQKGGVLTPASLSRTVRNNPTISTLRKIAEVIGADMMEFFEDESSQPIAPTPPEFAGEITMNGEKYGLVKIE